MGKQKKPSVGAQPTTPLIDRQRRLYAHAESIEVSQKKGEPLPLDISEWLHRALKRIALGYNPDEVFDIKPEKQGVRKDGLLLELQRNMANSYVAAATEEGEGKKTTAKAIEEISKAMPSTKKSTVRKNYNKLSTERKPTFAIGKNRYSR
jgi:hypothetical protein